MAKLTTLQKQRAKKGIRRASEIAGGQNALARAIGEKQGNISKWLQRGIVSPLACASIELFTKGEVARADLRPDVFGPKP